MTTISADCTVVIVTYQSAAVVGACLAALGHSFPVIVVDNASADDSTDAVLQRFPHVTLIRNTQNLGFGRACNIGIRAAATPFVLLLNPDARMTPEAVARLCETAAAYPDAAIVAPVVLGDDGAPQVTYRTDLFHRAESGRCYQPPEGPACADFLSGAVMLLRRDAILAFGGFDERLFLFYEDDDLCLQARKAGHSLIITPDATAIHAGARGSAPSPAVERLKQRHFAWSRLYVESKYRGHAPAQWLGLRLLALSALKALAYGLLLKRRRARKHLARVSGYLRWLRDQNAA